MLNKRLIMHALEYLGKELDSLDMQGEILLTGGAAMCLVHSARDMTKDIDALYEPKPEINLIVPRVAEEYGLPGNWLNDSVKGFITGDAPRDDFIVLPGLKIMTVPADFLLAMKLLAARYGETDYSDAKFLIKKMGLSTADAIVNTVLKYFEPNRILPKTMYLIEQIASEL